MKHYTTPAFWRRYEALPEDIQRLADKQFALLEQDPAHPSLRLKKVGKVWAARVSDNYRALAYRQDSDFV